jgi:hypothetical protein
MWKEIGERGEKRSSVVGFSEGQLFQQSCKYAGGRHGKKMRRIWRGFSCREVEFLRQGQILHSSIRSLSMI